MTPFYSSWQVFKRHNPSTAEEQEMMENLFDALCSCLMLSSNRERFLKGEGLQLMNLMLRCASGPHLLVCPSPHWCLALGCIAVVL